jgi:hypothetical protein
MKRNYVYREDQITKSYKTDVKQGWIPKPTLTIDRCAQEEFGAGKRSSARPPHPMRVEIVDPVVVDLPDDILKDSDLDDGEDVIRC